METFAGAANEGKAPVAGLFFTGTDTGVGKTFIAAAVAHLLRAGGCEVAVSKPVATGAQPYAGGWISDDTRLLAQAAGQEDAWRRITPWAFPEPVAPPVGARWHGVTLRLEELARAVRVLAKPDRFLLVEGVGGLLCPLTDHETVADLARELELPLVLVTRRSLGTLNHTLLTLEAACTRGLHMAGIVVNEAAPGAGPAWQTNIAELQQRVDVPVLAVVPFQAEVNPCTCAALAGIDWRRLCLTRQLKYS